MSVQFSPVLETRTHALDLGLSVQSLNLRVLGAFGSPIVTLDDFRLTAPICGPQPQAGVAAITYVFEDSRAGLRSRDSSGSDIVMRPGSVACTQAGSDIVHDELPAEARCEVHALQVLVNLRSKTAVARQVASVLEPEVLPQWGNNAGDRVRVVAGSFAGLVSPLMPAEHFTLLDVHLRSAMLLDLPHTDTALLYVLSGVARVVGTHEIRRLESAQAIAIQCSGGGDLVQVVGSAHLLILSAANKRKAVRSNHAPFTNESSTVDAAQDELCAARA